MSGNSRHIPELDGVRGLAIATVLLFHSIYAAMFPLYNRPPAPWSGSALWLARATEFGWAGVDLFFVLSGFLITRILLGSREREDYYPRFFVRRARRILPLYFAVLGLLAIFGFPLGFLGLSALFLANLTPIFHVPMAYLPLWSVALEVQFYLIWPWMVRRTSERSLGQLCLAILILTPLVRALGYGVGANTYAYSWFRFDAFAAGAWLALYQTRWAEHPKYMAKRIGQLFRWTLGLALGLSAVGAPFGIFDRSRLVGTSLIFSVWILLSTAILASALSANATGRSSLWRNRALSWLGLYSYGIYLIHPLIFFSWDGAGSHINLDSPLKVLLRAGVVISLSLIAARTAYEWIERPAMG